MIKVKWEFTNWFQFTAFYSAQLNCRLIFYHNFRSHLSLWFISSSKDPKFVFISYATRITWRSFSVIFKIKVIDNLTIEGYNHWHIIWVCRTKHQNSLSRWCRLFRRGGCFLRRCCFLRRGCFFRCGCFLRCRCGCDCGWCCTNIASKWVAWTTLLTICLKLSWKINYQWIIVNYHLWKILQNVPDKGNFQNFR